MQKGNQAAASYDRDGIDLRVVQKELRKNREKEKTAIIVLDEAIPLIRGATNAAAVGYKALVAYLEDEAHLQEMHNTDVRYLKASLDAELERRNSPINFRVEILWRLATVLQEFRHGNREQSLRLAHHIYEKLLERCDPEQHPFQYAGLANTMELCEVELERVTGYKIMNRSNRDFEFAPLDDPANNYDFQRKHNQDKDKDDDHAPHTSTPNHHKDKDKDKDKERDKKKKSSK
jgi:hypothetical protein